MTDVDVDALVVAIDERVLALGEGCDPARLFGVRLRGGGDFVLVPFWSGVARELPLGYAPPDGCFGIAMETGGWVAPMDDGLEVLRPSQHPLRQRMHHTCLVYGNGEDVSVLRVDNKEPQVLRGAVGTVLELIVACWNARRNTQPTAPSGGV